MNDVRSLIDELHVETSRSHPSLAELERLCRAFIALRLRQSAPTMDALEPIQIEHVDSIADLDEKCGPVNVDGTGREVAP